MKKMTLIFIMACMSILAISCSTSASSGSTKNAASTLTLVMLKTNTPTIEAAPVKVDTLFPTAEATYTSPPIATPRPTVESTLTSDQAKNAILQLLKTNQDCPSACFFGIMPGITDSQTVQNLFSHLRHPIPSTHGFVDIRIDRQIGILAWIQFNNGKVKNLRANVREFELSEVAITNQDWYAFRPDSIMNTYGKPSRIGLDVGYEPVMASYVIYFIYDELDFTIGYIGHSVDPTPALSICPLADADSDGFDVWIGKNLDEYPSPPKMLEDATSLSLDEFYDLITSNEDPCFTVDTSVFPRHGN